MFHRTFAQLSVASFFLLSANSINTMDLNLDLLKLLPYELCHRIDTHIPPIAVQEKILDAEEHAAYNLPFKFNPKDLTEICVPKGHGSSLQYRDPKNGNLIKIHALFPETKEYLHCLGPCRIKQQDNVCLSSTDISRYRVWSLKSDFNDRMRTSSHFSTYFKCSSQNTPTEDIEYVVDINNAEQAYYTAISSGEINAYYYNQASDSCAKKLIKPHLEIIWEVRDKRTTGGEIDCDIQFDHTQPDILLVRGHSSTTAYSVIHRPTQYTQFFPGQEIRSDGQNIVPLLASESESRLRLLGNTVGVKLVTVTIPTSCCAIRTLQLVKRAWELWAHWEGSAKHKNEARDIIAIFKMLIPKSEDRYFYVWYSKQENGAYALTELYNAQK